MSDSEYSSPISGDSDYDDDSLPPATPRPIPRVIRNWTLVKTLGSGYSGSIFEAVQNYREDNVVALKVQRVDHECPTNRYERYLYPSLQGGKGMPLLYDSFIHQEWDCLAIELLGPSLDSLFRKSGKATMDLGSVCSIAMQLISRLQTMHTRGILHRDIQLGNCVIGLPPNDKLIYMIDFGFSKRYIDPQTNRHIPDSREKRDFIGNYWFSSVNVHCKGRVPSRRDDMEAAALMLIHLLTPNGLSWTRNGVPKTDEAHDQLILEKQSARPEDLCHSMPGEFEEFLRECRKMKFMECPKYDKWIATFRDLAIEHGYSGRDDFVWPPKPPSRKAPRPVYVPPPRTVHSASRETMEEILAGLTKLNFNTQPVIGDRANVEAAAKKVKENLHKSAERKVASSGNDSALAGGRTSKPKAMLLAELSNKASKATDNASLAKLVNEFAQILQMNSSKTLTKEASKFLDLLYKQLYDPSIFIQPAKAVRTRSFGDKALDAPAHAKLGVVAQLRYDVRYAPDNKTLASLVEDFANVTNRCAGRTITKDGFLFLEGLAQRLLALQ